MVIAAPCLHIHSVALQASGQSAGQLTPDVTPLLDRPHPTGWVDTVLSAPAVRQLVIFWSEKLDDPHSTD